jgi:hypothetical protein
MFDLLEDLEEVESVTPAHAYKVRVIAETNIKTDKTRYPFFASQN